MLRQPPRGTSIKLLSFSAFAISATLIACGVDFASTTSPSPLHDDPYKKDDAAAGDGAGHPGLDGADAGATGDAVAPPFLSGNPLCNASEARGCYPDLPASPETCGADAGAVADADAGSLGLDSAAPALACRVRATGTNGASATCDPLGAGPGHDGDPCQKGADCGAGFECVGTTGQCRHYCCMADACTTASGHLSFCDVQPLAENAGTKVPACMPVQPCKLLDTNYCPQGQQCEIVRSDGTTSCVAIGGATVGASCDGEHCAAGLTCIGNVGNRTCYQLCHTDSSTDCSAPLKCRTSVPTFQDPTIGICAN
jgi:hypothetical protein